MISSATVAPSPGHARPSGRHLEDAEPFAGKGLFTAWDPATALNAPFALDWVAVLPEKITPSLAAAFRERGTTLVLWQPVASVEGVAAIARWGAAGYIAQAETPDELAAALRVADTITVPKAVVTNNFFARHPAGWISLPEAYANEAPNQTPTAVVNDARNRGATVAIPVIGVFHPSTPGAVKLPVSAYEVELSSPIAPGVAAYLAEQMDSSDLLTFGRLGLGRIPARPPSCGGPGEPGKVPLGFDGGLFTFECGTVAVGESGELDSRISALTTGETHAYVVKHLGGARGLSGSVRVSARVRVDADAVVTAEVPFLQIVSVDGSLIYELYLDQDRIVHLRSPAGGLRGTPIDASTGVAAPLVTDSVQPLALEVTAQIDNELLLKVNGLTRLMLKGLKGAPARRQGTLRAGIIGYAAQAGDRIGIFQTAIAAVAKPVQAVGKQGRNAKRR